MAYKYKPCLWDSFILPFLNNQVAETVQEEIKKLVCCAQCLYMILKFYLGLQQWF